MKTNLEPPIVAEPVAEPTLGEVLTRAVRTTVPTWLYQLLHLALPLAVDFGYRGWWRPAMAAVALSAFGAWGLTDRWLWSAAEWGYEQTGGWRVRLARLARLITGTTAATLAALLALEAFLRLLGAPPSL
jgi:hypothetical protein